MNNPFYVAGVNSLLQELLRSNTRCDFVGKNIIHWKIQNYIGVIISEQAGGSEESIYHKNTLATYWIDGCKRGSGGAVCQTDDLRSAIGW